MARKSFQHELLLLLLGWVACYVIMSPSSSSSSSSSSTSSSSVSSLRAWSSPSQGDRRQQFSTEASEMHAQRKHFEYTRATHLQPYTRRNCRQTACVEITHRIHITRPLMDSLMATAFRKHNSFRIQSKHLLFQSCHKGTNPTELAMRSFIFTVKR